MASSRTQSLSFGTVPKGADQKKKSSIQQPAKRYEKAAAHSWQENMGMFFTELGRITTLQVRPLWLT